MLVRSCLAVPIASFALVVAAACGSSDGASPSATPDAGDGGGGGPPPNGPDAAPPDRDASSGDAGPRVVDPTTLEKKLVMGYQGWFACPGDGAPPNRWVHWFRGLPADATTVTVDLWPSTKELDADELCATTFTRPDGTPAPLYSAWRAKTVARHFAWMRDHDLDGVFLQRFTSELADPAFKALRDQVLKNVMAAAEATGRVFAVEYDISGQSAATVVDTLKSDWAYLVDVIGVTKSPRYLRHAGKPVVEVWGFGFPDRPGTVQQAMDTISWFRNDAPAAQRATLIGGVPREWRTDATWAPVARSFDVINPWTVGAFVDDAGANAYAATLAADIADAKSNGRALMPVVFPGFSWKNLNGGPLNQIPRRAGRFYWRQVFNAIDRGATMIFGAMFDEVDEGTAMYKLAPTKAEMPAQGTFVPLDVDGTKLPDDWYLRCADQAGKMLRSEIPKTATLPITP